MNKIKLAVAVAMLLASPALAQPSRHAPRDHFGREWAVPARC